MATRQLVPLAQIRRELQDAPQLRPFLLNNVTQTGKQLGGGSYGVVVELEMGGIVCAGKTIYDALIDAGNEGAQNMVDKYYRECSLLAELRHPYIVQFLGICFLRRVSPLPVLVMERLQGSLDELLETTPDIPLSTKLSILHDVTKGLVFLHNRTPAVIHRDLTARNVLLNSAMTAKIADLGNARIANLHPGQLAQTMTQGIPGTLVYMPPEASTQRYGTPLDMFSFGHLALFTAIQVFPGDLLPPTYMYTDSRKTEVKARTELERREKYITTLNEKPEFEYELSSLIEECLAYKPQERPSARDAMKRLGGMREMEQDHYQHMNRLQLEKTLTEKITQVEVQATEINTTGERIKRLQTQLWKKEAEKKEMKEECSEKEELLAAKELQLEQISVIEEELADLKVQKRQLETECKVCHLVDSLRVKYISAVEQGHLAAKQGLDTLFHENYTLKFEKADEVRKVLIASRKDIKAAKKEIKAKEAQLMAKDTQLSEMADQLTSLQEEHTTVKTQLDIAQKHIQIMEVEQRATKDIMPLKDAHISTLTTKVKEMSTILQAKNKLSGLLPNVLTYKLFLTWNQPMQMPSGVASAQAVVVGDKVYTGGGGSDLSKSKILKYTIAEGQFGEIESPVMAFGMAVVNDQFIIAGGKHNEFDTTAEVWVWDGEDTNGWTQPFPAMPMATEWCSAVGYRRWLLVFGRSIVTVLDTHFKKWYDATPLPSEVDRPSLAVIEDTLYVAWKKTFVSIFLPTLIAGGITKQVSGKSEPIEWRELADTLTEGPTLTSFHGQLLAVGASDTPSSTVAMYLPHVEEWKDVATLPSPRDGCACVVLPETQELMVIGGYDRFQFIKNIDIGCLEQV